MRIENFNSEQVAQLIAQAGKIAVVPAKVAGTDAFCAAAGLYTMLKDSGKETSLIYTGKVPDNAVNLVKPDEISSNISQRELVVRIDYSGTPAARAHYSTEDDIFVLRLSPVPREFDLDNVRIKVTGFDFDLMIVVGAQSLEDLGGVFKDLRQEFDRSRILNLDNVERNERFGVANVVDTRAESLSMLIYENAFAWGLKPNSKSAKALLTGMMHRNGVEQNGHN